VTDSQGPAAPAPLDLNALAAQWRNRAQVYRKQADGLLFNKAGEVERKTLGGHARAYETCAEELQFALGAVQAERPREPSHNAVMAAVERFNQLAPGAATASVTIHTIRETVNAAYRVDGGDSR